jgi:hypothetical protein
MATDQEARLAELFRQLTAILIASLVTGILVGGIGARAFMLVARVLAPERRGFVTEAEARVGEVTIVGSLFLILFVGVFAAMAIGVTVGVGDQWTAWAGRFRGLVTGVMLLVTFNAVILDPRNFDFALLSDQEATVAMIVALFLLAGVTVVWLRNRVIERLPLYDSLSGKGSGYVPGALLGAVGLVLVTAAILVPDNRADGSLPTVLSFVALTVVTLIDRGWWIRRGTTPPLLVRILGFGTLAVLIALGTAQLVGAIDGIVA